MEDAHSDIPPKTVGNFVGEPPVALMPLCHMPHWVGWQWKRKNGGWTKPPYRVDAPDAHASCNDPETWGTLKAAILAMKGGKVKGIGFALLDTQYGAVDLDDCRDPASGRLTGWAQRLFDRAKEIGAYVEVTPSGTGLRIIGTADGEKLHRKLKSEDGGSVELYRKAERYICITFQEISQCNVLPNIDALIDEIVTQYGDRKKPNHTQKTDGQGDWKESAKKLPDKIKSIIRDGVAEPYRSEQFFHVVAHLKRVGWNADDIDALLQRYPTGIAAKYEGRLRCEIDRCFGKAEDQADSAGDNKSRTVLALRAGNLHNIATEAEKILIAAEAPFYARGGEIMKPIVEDVPAFKGRRTKVTRLKVVGVDMLRDHLSRAIDFRKFDKRSKKEISVDPPSEVAQIILSRDGDWKFLRLVGITTTPTLRPDGSILLTPGYDQATGLLLVSPPAMPPIPDQPTKDDAITAVGLLNDLLTEFPLVGEADRSVAVSILMTPVARGAMQVAPLHAVTAPEPRTGKSYLLDTAAAIATGEIAPAIAAGRNEEETEKRIGAELITGQPIISIDNLNGDLSGDFICQAIERPIIKPRILGLSKNKRVENNVTIFCNGNNLRFIGDIAPRVLLCSMDANMERPETRRFSGDPVATVLADRGKYIAAILTIIRAYLAAGAPEQCVPMPSFGGWSKFVRSSLIWLGFKDPADTVETARAEDPSRVALREVVAIWVKLWPAQKITAGDLKSEATKATYGDDTGDRATLNAALLAVAPERNRVDIIDAKKLGQWLGRNKGRIIDGHKIIGEKDRHTKQTVWWLMKVGPAKAGNNGGQ